jgi:cell division initiation protein
MFEAAQATSALSPAESSPPPARVTRLSPLDLRQQKFKTAVRGFDRTEVVAFLTEAADDYEGALREIDHLRHELKRSESSLVEHREREGTLRNTLVTAQKLADEIKVAAENEAALVIREAKGRAELLLQQAQGRVDEIARSITELRLRRRDAEGTLENTVQALNRALEFIRAQDTDGQTPTQRPLPVPLPAAAAAVGQPHSAA